MTMVKDGEKLCTTHCVKTRYKTVFEGWLGLCEENGNLPWMLESRDGREETGLFMIKREYMMNYTTYYETPVYLVWIDGKNILATTNYLEAYNTWVREIAKA